MLREEKDKLLRSRQLAEENNGGLIGHIRSAHHFGVGLRHVGGRWHCIMTML